MIGTALQRLWPRSLKAQVLMTIGLALLLAQGLNAVLVYRAQAERRDAMLFTSAAFRLIHAPRADDRASGASSQPRRRSEGRSRFRLDTSPVAPIQPGEERVARAEEALQRILAEQNVEVDGLVVIQRQVAQERPALDRLAVRPQQTRALAGDRTVLVAAVRRSGEQNWLIARVLLPENQRELVLTLIGQLLFTYLVLVGAVALMLRRITRPLAALTDRLELFAHTRAIDGQLEPQGPSDVRGLILAHNAMEDRIAALLAEKDVMLGAIGHDLKTPLAALRVRIESVEDEAEREKMAATIEDIVRSLDDILSLARVGRSTDPEEPTELSALVASIVEEYEDMGEDVILGDTQRIVIPLRSTWLRRAVRNLIGNALRYGKQARVTLAREDAEAVIRIDDDGPGIPPEMLATMFEPFKRGEPSRNTETGGAGLGLTLALAIAEQHGGSLAIANRTGTGGKIDGLTATLRLPLS